MPAPVDISDPFRALSDPTRREIVSLLAGGSLPVRMIAAHFPSISRPAVSKHLRILREGGLVTEERSGRERFYRLELETVRTTLGWMASVGERAGQGTKVARSKSPVSSRARKRPSSVEPKKRASGVRATESRLEPAPPEPVEIEGTVDEGVDLGDWKSW